MGDLIKFPLLRRQDAIALESQTPAERWPVLTALGAQVTCHCGQWPIEEYGEVCPSCGMADVERSDFELEVNQEEFDTAYALAESFEGTYDGSEGTFDHDNCPPRLIGSPSGEWLHQILRNAGRCARCGNLAQSGWSWFDPVVTTDGIPVAQHFTCDDCAESL